MLHRLTTAIVAVVSASARLDIGRPSPEEDRRQFTGGRPDTRKL
jgi:hypothetical protein